MRAWTDSHEFHAAASSVAKGGGRRMTTDHPLGPDTAAIEALVDAHGDTRRMDDAVVAHLPTAQFIAFARACVCCGEPELMAVDWAPRTGEPEGIAVPVWTRDEYIDQAILTSPDLRQFAQIELSGLRLVDWMDPEWGIVINPWCDATEYEIPSSSCRRAAATTSMPNDPAGQEDDLDAAIAAWWREGVSAAQERSRNGPTYPVLHDLDRGAETVVGRVTAVELRFTADGRSVSQFEISLERRYVPRREVLRCLVWGAAAEDVAESDLGTVVEVTGRMMHVETGDPAQDEEYDAFVVERVTFGGAG